MKLAMLSDIHANLHALQACLDHAQAQGVDQWVFLGDLVGYGANPSEVLNSVMTLVDQGAWVIQGNHDAMAVSPPQQSESLGSSTAAWTHAQLNKAQRAFLQERPLFMQHAHLFLVHASAQDPDKWHYVDSDRAATLCLKAAQTQHAGIQHVFVGHVHQQYLYYPGAGRGLMAFKPTPGVAVPCPATRAAVVTVGSVGQPRDGDPRAMYAMYDLEAARLTFHRVAYDHTAAAAAIMAAGLPVFFANRLKTGR